MAVVLTNNAISRLASSLTAGATALSVTAGEGAKFPSVPAGKWFPVTLLKASGALEIMHCTARSGDVLTVLRSREGTAAQAFAVGDRVELRLTAAAIDEFKQTSDISTFMRSMLDDADAAAARNTLELKPAATTDLTSSATDLTPGRIMRAGDGGAIIPVSWSADVNGITASGLYNVAGSSANWPFVGAGGTLIHNVHIAGSYQSQVASSVVATEERIRVMNNGVWSAWDRVTLDKHFSTYFRSLFLSADAAAARSTLGAYGSPDFAATLANNGGQSIANKMMIQWGSYSATPDQAVAVTFPTAFPTVLVAVIPIMNSSNLGSGGERNPRTFNYARTGATIQMGAPITGIVCYMAIGY